MSLTKAGADRNSAQQAIVARARRTGNTGFLLTPGPLTVELPVKQAMLRDWGSREGDFIALTAGIRHELAELVQAGDSHSTVLLPGSGTTGVEAMLGSLVGRDDRLLVLVNGAYGARMVEMARRMGYHVEQMVSDPCLPLDPTLLVRRLDANPPDIVALVHCETSSGVLNPLPELSRACRSAGVRLFVDAMSSFGAIPIDCSACGITALVASANKCLQSVPGITFVLARHDALQAAAGRSVSLVLDLHAQWRGFEETGQWRFTPPTHVVAALRAALDELGSEGGIVARHDRYQQNCRILVDGMMRLGFPSLVPMHAQAPIIVTFSVAPDFPLGAFHDELVAHGIVLYPGKLTDQPSFRVGCIGAVRPDDMSAILTLIGEVASRFSAYGGGSA